MSDAEARKRRVKAKVPFDPKNTIKLSTANGIGEGMVGRAQHIKLKSIQATDIAVVVQADAAGAYGGDLDGLLGMNLLARYQIVIDGKTLRIKRRVGR